MDGVLLILLEVQPDRFEAEKQFRRMKREREDAWMSSRVYRARLRGIEREVIRREGDHHILRRRWPLEE